MTQHFPLTEFIIKMLKADPSSMRSANPDKLADKYDIAPAHARGFIRLRGVR